MPRLRHLLYPTLLLRLLRYLKMLKNQSKRSAEESGNLFLRRRLKKALPPKLPHQRVVEPSRSARTRNQKNRQHRSQTREKDELLHLRQPKLLKNQSNRTSDPAEHGEASRSLRAQLKYSQQQLRSPRKSCHRRTQQEPNRSATLLRPVTGLSVHVRVKPRAKLRKQRQQNPPRLRNQNAEAAKNQFKA